MPAPETSEPPTPEIAVEKRRALLDLARDVAGWAYVPYSKFPVGAAAITADGEVFAGANVENASFGLTICAERSAVTALISAGHRDIVAIAVSAPRVALTTPCGACRQVLNEFRPVRDDMVVILDDRADGHAIWLADLLPKAFGSRNLDAAGEQEGTGDEKRPDTRAG